MENNIINASVNGKTTVLGIIGCPVTHSFSPIIHNTIANMNKENTVYVPFEPKPEELSEAVEGAFALKIKGLNVTVPHKVNVMKYLYDVDKKALSIGAVNTLKYTEKGYVGYNTDIIGVKYSLEKYGFDIKNKKVLILGAGGASNACTAMAASEEAKKIYIANRTLSKAQNLKENINKYYDTDIDVLNISDTDNIDNVDIVINCTTMGFGDKKDQTPIENKNFFKEKNVQLVFDAIYTPWKTRLLKEASQAGVNTLNGFDMLIYQAIAAQEIWFDKKIDTFTSDTLKNTLSQYYRGNSNE